MTYDPGFYDLIRPGVRASAEVIAPLMDEWYRGHRPDYRRNTASVVDVGCGEGWWALEWVIGGYATSVDGIDGPWPGAGDALRHRPDTDFVPLDLETVDLDGWPGAGAEYDIALCLEVAEHLDDPWSFMSWLRRLAPVVFFSAAVPGQPGNHHVNCHWQSTWARDFLYAGWKVADPIRPQVWEDGRVEWWYAQNLFVAWHPDGPIRAPEEPVRSMIHPRLWDVR